MAAAEARRRSEGDPGTRSLSPAPGLLLLLLALGNAASHELHRSVVLGKGGRLQLVAGLRPDGIAWANFTDRIKGSGWVTGGGCGCSGGGGVGGGGEVGGGGGGAVGVSH